MATEIRRRVSPDVLLRAIPVMDRTKAELLAEIESAGGQCSPEQEAAVAGWDAKDLMEGMLAIKARFDDLEALVEEAKLHLDAMKRTRDVLKAQGLRDAKMNAWQESGAVHPANLASLAYHAGKGRVELVGHKESIMDDVDAPYIRWESALATDECWATYEKVLSETGDKEQAAASVRGVRFEFDDYVSMHLRAPGKELLNAVRLKRLLGE